MCSHPGSGAKLNGSGGSGSPGGADNLEIHRQTLQKLLSTEEGRAKTAVLCIVERDEPYAAEPPIPNSTVIPMGELVVTAIRDEAFRRAFQDKLIVVYCQVGIRGHMVAQELVKYNYKIVSLAGGGAAWLNPAACLFDFVTLLGYSPSDKAEQVTLALNMTLSALRDGNTCALMLIGEAVCMALKHDEGSYKALPDSTAIGPPFLSIKELLNVRSGRGLLQFSINHHNVPKLRYWKPSLLIS
ncbi:hypothetical protein Pelo_11168 [Pelomyxa schiedti]|nr:hypothetical protein Pelo_11168 [Pelomyxa schiedti]